MLIATALITVYLVLGILYESLIHPITILSAIPSAGVGAMLGVLPLALGTGTGSDAAAAGDYDYRGVDCEPDAYSVYDAGGLFVFRPVAELVAGAGEA